MKKIKAENKRQNSEKYYLTRRNIDKSEHIMWKQYNKDWGSYIYDSNIESADEFTLKQIEKIQVENIDDVILDYACKVKDILKLKINFIHREDFENMEAFRLISPNLPKRSPLADGTLPLTEGELVKLNGLLKYGYWVEEVRLVTMTDRYLVRAYGKINTERAFIDEVNAILWLAERFDLEVNDGKRN